MLKCVFRTCIFDSFKSSLINAVFCPTLNMHMSQDLVGKGKKRRIKSCQHYATAALDIYYCRSTVQCGSHPKHHAGGFFVLSIQKENKNVITLGWKLDMSKFLLLNMNIFLKLCLSGIHNAMAIGKDVISLTTSWLHFYIALIEHNWLQKNTYLWSISMDLNRVSFISKEYEVKGRDSIKISNIGSAVRNESRTRRAVINICS